MYSKKNSAKTVRYLTRSALICALYLLLTYLSSMLSLSNGVVQIRLSEVLCVLPAFFPSAIPGLALGCLISNFLCGALIWDVLFGSLATLLGAVGTYLLRTHRFLRLLVPIVCNAIVIGLVLRYAYWFPLPLWTLMTFVAIGEFLSCGIFGYFFGEALEKRRKGMGE